MILDLIQLEAAGPLLVGCIGIGVALVNQRRQLNAQMFIEFSGRFQDMLRMFPTEAWLANRNPAQPLPPPSQAVTDCTLYSIQFISDAYYLHRSAFVSRKIWRLWEREITRTLSGRVFQREWPAVAAEFEHDPEFLQYIEKLIGARRPRKSAAVSNVHALDDPEVAP